MKVSGLTDLRQSPQYANFTRQTGWQVINIKPKVFAYKRSLGPLGSIIKIQRFPWPINLIQLDILAQKHRALFIKLEPAIIIKPLDHKTTRPVNQIIYKSKHQQIKKIAQQPITQLPNYLITRKLKSHGFYPDKWPLIPTSTRVIDLTKSKKRLLTDSSPNCRRNLKKAQKNHLTAKLGNWQWFYRHWQQAANQQRLVIPSHSHFQALVRAFKQNLLLISIIDQHQQWLAGIVMPIIRDNPPLTKGGLGGVAYYLHASSTPKGKHLRAPYLAAWTAITLAQKTHCQIFDFDGIADPRYPANNTSAWQGFTQFKSKFGGRQVTYIGSFIKYYGPGKILGLLDKIFN